MKSYNVVALTALLSAGAQAVPMAGHAHEHAKNLHAHMHHAKRDIVWVTTVEIETVTVVTTVYEDGTEPTSQVKVYLPPVKTTKPAAPSSSQAPQQPSPPAEKPAPAPSSPSYIPAPVPSSSSSVYVAPAPAPTPSSSAAPAPPPSTPTYVAPPPPPSTYVPPSPVETFPPSNTYTAPAPSQTYGGGDTSGIAHGSFTGEFTYWDPALGACGFTNANGEDVVAVSKVLFDKYTPGGNPNKNPLCGMKISLTGKDGQAYPATIVDRCEGCKSNDLDLTRTLFDKVTSKGDGRVAGMSWDM